MDKILIGGSIIEGVLLTVGLIMWWVQNKYKYKNMNAQNTIWKLVEYFAMLLGGYLIGGKVA